MLSLVEIQERYYSISNISYSEKEFRVLPTGVEPMTFRTLVGCYLILLCKEENMGILVT